MIKGMTLFFRTWSDFDGRALARKRDRDSNPDPYNTVLAVSDGIFGGVQFKGRILVGMQSFYYTL